MGSNAVITVIYKNLSTYFSKHSPPSLQVIQYGRAGIIPPLSHKQTDSMRFLDLTKPHCYSAWGQSIGNLNLLTLSPLNFPTPSAIQTSFQVPRQSRSKHSSGICPLPASLNFHLGPNNPSSEGSPRSPSRQHQ